MNSPREQLARINRIKAYLASVSNADQKIASRYIDEDSFKQSDDLKPIEFYRYLRKLQSELRELRWTVANTGFKRLHANRYRGKYLTKLACVVMQSTGLDVYADTAVNSESFWLQHPTNKKQLRVKVNECLPLLQMKEPGCILPLGLVLTAKIIMRTASGSVLRMKYLEHKTFKKRIAFAVVMDYPDSKPIAYPTASDAIRNFERLRVELFEQALEGF